MTKNKSVNVCFQAWITIEGVHRYIPRKTEQPTILLKQISFFHGILTPQLSKVPTLPLVIFSLYVSMLLKAHVNPPLSRLLFTINLCIVIKILSSIDPVVDPQNMASRYFWLGLGSLRSLSLCVLCLVSKLMLVWSWVVWVAANLVGLGRL